MLRPLQIQRFYLAVPLEDEENVLEKIGKLGFAQLIKGVSVESFEKSETVEACRRFMRLYERLKAILAKITPEKQYERIAEENKPNLGQIRLFLDQIEPELESISTINKVEEEIKNLKMAEERLEFLKKYGLRTDELGNFRHIFVKTGLIKNALLPKLNGYLNGTSVVYASKPGKIGESLIIITGYNEDQSLTEVSLKLLNFDEFKFPQTLNPEPELAQKEVKDSIELKEKEIQNLKEDLLKVKDKFDSLEPTISETLKIEEAKGFIARTKTKSLITGWILSDKVDSLKAEIEKIIPRESIYLRFEHPNPNDEVPVQFKSRSLLNSFESLTYLQGVPNYFEINPTLIYMFLYVLMFGIILGDIGDGSILIILGILLARSRKGLFSFSSSTIRKIGQIIISCGVSAIVFGILDGQLFLFDMGNSILNPLANVGQIVIVALIFGVVQISLALSLNIINKIRMREISNAIFRGHGVIGLVYYVSGVFLSISFIREANFNVFLRGSNLFLTLIAIVSLFLIFLSPSIETLIAHRKARFSEKLFEGFGEVLETFVSFIANSVSYIRLAAFAIAHESLGLAATILTPLAGSLFSYLIMNVIAFITEGFAAFIQSLRLMYYEFSTKFYVGDGIPYKPFKIIASERKT